VVAFFYVLALLAVGLSVFQTRPLHTGAPSAIREPARKDLVLFALLCAVLCATFALQIALTDRAVLSQAPLPDWFRALPLLYFAPYPPIAAAVDESLIQWTQVLAVVESVILLGMYFALRRIDCRGRAFAAVTFLSMAILSVIALRSVTTDVDSYLYIGNALVWTHEYVAPPIPFAGEDAVINRMWGMPLLPSAYGPLWGLIAKLSLGSTRTLWQQAFEMRLLGLISIAVCVAYVSRLQRSSVTALLFALNPAMYVRYLIRAHNDLTGVALILVAAAARKRTWLAVLLVAAAGTIKFPLLLGGLIVFWDRPTLAKRLTPALAAALLAAGASWVFGGPAYANALKVLYRFYDHSPSPAEQVFHLLLVAVAFGAVALALIRRRFLFGAGWSFVSLGQFPLAHYLAWCLPYVLLGEATAIPFLVSWPVLDQALTLEYPYTPFFLFERSAAVIAVIAAVGLALLSHRSKRNA
jgi:hypothetical protein